MLNLLAIFDFGSTAPADVAEDLLALLRRESAVLPGVVSTHVAKTLPNALYGGHVIWRVTFGSEQDYWDCVVSQQWQGKIAPALTSGDGRFIDVVTYRSIRSNSSSDLPTQGIWRCLVLAVDADTPNETVRAFEQDMVLMPDYISTIGSWAFGRALTSDGRRRWTHVWEQEFENIAGLEGEYMLNPIHWGFIDAWFDPESSKRIVDIVCIVHAASARQGVVIV